MFNTTSYYQQSRELPAENSFQYSLLKWADTSTALRELGKVGTIIGSVNAAASTVFGYDPALSISVAATSALTWLCCHKITANLEPQAQSMLEHFRSIERERNNPLNLVSFKINTLEKRQGNSRSLMNALRDVLRNKLKDENSIQKLNQLFEVLFLDNIKKLIVNDDQVEITLYEQSKKAISLESTILNIPQKIVFKIINNAIIFDEKFAPYEDRTGSSFIKSDLAWWEIEVKGEEFKLITPHNFGLFTTFAGGTPVVRKINAQNFLNSISIFLSHAITKAKSIAELNDIFINKVNIQLGWANDKVTVEGYEGSVSTDFIANLVLNLSDSETGDSKRLASFFAEKVFIQLKHLVDSPENQCSPYQLAALTRLIWTPPQAPEFGNSIALKHAMVLGNLDRKYSY